MITGQKERALRALKRDARSRVRFAALGMISALSASQPARAEWLEAQSPHFVIYADASPKTITRASEQLERYHAALELMIGTTGSVPSPSNRVTVFVVRNASAVQRLMGPKAQNVAGFYQSRAARSAAFVPRLESDADGDDWSLVVLRHEYAHHFLISNFSQAQPLWMGEGAAEFFASARNRSDGGLDIGLAAQHRAYGLVAGNKVPVIALLDPDRNAAELKTNGDAFYGRSWLLYHYLNFGAGRAGQLPKYAELLGSGATQLNAGKAAFGDFRKLDRDLDAYLMRSRLTMISLPAEKLRVTAPTIRPLRSGEAAVMPLHIQSRRGVSPEQAKALLLQIRPLAARFPGDPAVQVALAEAENDAGNHDAAVKAATAALILDPRSADAHLEKARGLHSAARALQTAVGSARDTAFVAARDAYIALNRLENDHPVPLFALAQIQMERGRPLSPNMLLAMERAVEVAPFDDGMRLSAGLALLKVGQSDRARKILQPLTFNPHDEKSTERVRAILARMAKEPDWNGDGAIVDDGPDDGPGSTDASR